MSRTVRKTGAFCAAVLAALCAGNAASAQEATPTLNAGDTAWMLTSTAIVLMMTLPGLALFYGGMVRKKNILSSIMQCFAIACIVTVLWMVAGYSLSFTAGTSYIGGLGRAFLSGIGTDTLKGAIPESVFVVFQLTFAIITAALITGAIAERMKFSALLWFIGLWSLLVYAPIAYWVWGGGFLGGAGVLDYAGGTVVHINSGVAALVAALVIGPRNGYGQDVIAPNNVVYCVVGASLLWVGWFGFNAGSAVAANGAAGMAMLVTQIATGAAALSWMFVEWAVRRKPTVLGIASGAVAGLVAITPASGFVDPRGALILGFVAGAICYWGAAWLKPRLGYDDSLDVFGIHAIGGIAGALLTGVFAVEAIGGKAGLLEGNAAQVGLQAYGVAVTVVYCAIASFIILKAVDLFVGLRVDAEVEREGLDLALHGEAVP